MNDLNELRAQIDALDDQLHDLLMQRFQITGQVAAAKGAQNDPSLIPRPARERSIVERLIERHDGALPPRSLVRIWREIMGAACHQQGDFRIGVIAAPLSHLGQGVREHFGTAVRLEFGDQADIFAKLAARDLALAVLDMADTVPAHFHEISELRIEGGAIGRLVSIHDLDQ